jgi:hypothetical protein
VWYSVPAAGHEQLRGLLRAETGEILPLPVSPYRRVRIQGDQGRGGLGYRSTV